MQAKVDDIKHGVETTMEVSNATQCLMQHI